MKFRMWYVGMGISAAVIFYSMIYLGHILCLPMESAPCIPMVGST
ncbi:MAG: hypothetical protein ACREBB_05355 [Nitrosotalea sp.]